MRSLPTLPVVPAPTARQRLVLVVAVVVLAAVLGWLVLGPGRGARDDIGAVRTDLHGTRGTIDDTLEVTRSTLTQLNQELQITADSLAVQQQGLDVASQSQQVARTGVDVTTDIKQQTGDTLATLQDVIAALGPLPQLRGDVDTVLAQVQAGVRLARSTLTIAKQTLSTGQDALEVARQTLTTLDNSLDVQRQTLEVARQTLAQTTEINRKIPLPPLGTTAGTPAR